MLTKQQLICSYGSFYHVTKYCKIGDIQLHGILPNKYPEMDYEKNAPLKLAQICLTIASKLEEIKEQIKDDCIYPVGVFEIDAAYLSTLNIGFDWTFTGTLYASRQGVVSGLKMSIEKLGTLACFDIIPPSRFKLL